MDKAQKILETVFGYKAFRLDQAEIIRTLVEGGDVLALMPTGGGKSLCYQIPALVREGTGIVVSPLIALMQDQVDALSQLGVRAAFLNSTLEPRAQRDVEQRLLDGDLDLLYVAPERLVTPQMLDLLNHTRLALFAIDEAHCVSQWGHDFRPEYRQLSCLAEGFAGVPRIALTATADQRTRDEIITELRLQSASRYVASFDRPNIRYTISEGSAPRDRLWRLLEEQHPNDAGIIYCLSRKKVEDVADWLTRKGRNALPYHAGLPADQRRRNQERFLRDDGIVIVATIAFGMGIDKPDVRFVAHLNLPKSIEAYYQETGRAGRDGEASNAWLAYGLQDVVTLRQWIEQSEAGDMQKAVERQKLDALLGLCELTTCRRQTLLGYFGEPLPEPCGNCDNCISPPQTMDGTQLAQKALSAVYRTGQRFGVNYIVDVLMGKADPRIVKNGHDKISTFGIGADLETQIWRGVFRQLVARGFIYSDFENYGALKLTKDSRPLLRGEITMQLRMPRKAKSKAAKSTGPTAAIPAGEQPLYDALKAARTRMAKQQGVPPYIICHDKTLREIAAVRPTSCDQLLEISGLGAVKIKRYGQLLLDVVAGHGSDKPVGKQVSAGVKQILELHGQGKQINDIATALDLEVDMVFEHFASAIKIGYVEAQDILEIDDDDISQIHETFDRLGTLESGELGLAFEALERRFDYGALKCLLAELS